MPLMQGLAPVVLSIFPLFLVAISKAADELVSGTSLDKLDVEEFEMQENRRLKLLEIQSISMQREALVVQQIINAEAQQKRNELLRKRIASGTIKITEVNQTGRMEIATSNHVQPAIQAPRDDVDTGHETDEDMDLSMDVLCPGHGQNADEEMDISLTSNVPKIPIKISSRRKSMSVAEAAAFLECSDRQVRRLRENGTLITDEDDRITSASVRAYKKKRAAKFGPEGA